MRKSGAILAAVLGVLAVLLSQLLPLRTATAAASRLRVVFRYDDYSRLSDTDLEKDIFGTVDDAGMSLVVAVIPFPGRPYPWEKDSNREEIGLGETKAGLLRTYVGRGAVDLAVHGYSHRANFDGPPGKSEFATLPLVRQRQLLVSAKEELERTMGLRIDSFVPPFNSFDDNTVIALGHVGFKLISAGITSIQRDHESLRSLPGTLRPQRLRKTIEGAQSEGLMDALVVVTMHSFDFAESGEPLPACRMG